MIFYNVDKKLSSDGKGAYSIRPTKSLIPVQKNMSEWGRKRKQDEP